MGKAKQNKSYSVSVGGVLLCDRTVIFSSFSVQEAVPGVFSALFDTDARKLPEDALLRMCLSLSLTVTMIYFAFGSQ